MNTEQELRDSWQRFVESQVWEGEDEYTKNMGVGNVADFWLTERRKELEKLRQEVEGLLDEEDKVFGDEALVRIGDVLSLINSELK